jgi:predicted RNase H-related nuclease YkuK (DUF458 family)
MDTEAVKEFIASSHEDSKIYIGCDSQRFRGSDKRWYADYAIVVVVHKAGRHGCKIFGQIEREQDFDQRKDRPAMRLMNEVMKSADMYLQLADVLEDRYVEVHLDINPNEVHGSSCVVGQAIGYIKGVCNVTPMVKPDGWAATHAADHVAKHREMLVA